MPGVLESDDPRTPGTLERKREMAKKQLAIEYVPTADLAADPANLRKHSEKNLKAVEGSIKRFGFQTPIVVDADNIIVAGHARYEVLKSLGHEKIPVIRTELTGADRVAYAIADNRTSELAEWDDAALADVLKELENIGEIGFDDADIGMFDVDPMSEDSIVGAGDRPGLQQLSFTLTDHQANTVKVALHAANTAGPYADTGNENGNGNALARIAEAYRGAG